jgi:hypothetical protein
MGDDAVDGQVEDEHECLIKPIINKFKSLSSLIKYSKEMSAWAKDIQDKLHESERKELAALDLHLVQDAEVAREVLNSLFFRKASLSFLKDNVFHITRMMMMHGTPCRSNEQCLHVDCATELRKH